MAWVVLTNRAIALFAIWATAIMACRRKGAETALRKSEASLAEAQRIARIGNWERDFAKQGVRYSDELYRILGVDPQSYVPNFENLLQRVHPDDRKAVAACHREGLDSGEPFETAYRIVAPDGSIRHVRSRAEVVRDDRGRKLRMAGIVQDITEQKRAEAALRESREMLSAVVDNSPSAIVLKDLEGRYRLINRCYQEWYGLAKEDAIGKTTHDLFPAEIADAYVARDREALEKNAVLEMELNFVSRFPDASERQLVMTKFPVRDGSGDPMGVGMIATDITAHRNVEAQLRQAQRMEAVGQLTGGVAHEFNNLLMVVLGNLELLEEQLGGEDSLRRLARNAIKGARRGGELTQRLLAFSRRQTLKAERIDLNALVADMGEILHRTLGETIAIETVSEPDLWPTIADSGQVEVALLNFAINARDAMPAGGTITVWTGNRHIAAGDPDMPPEIAPGDYVVLEVGDCGSGMTADIADRAFEPFFTTKGVGEGTGLGLSMAYGFARQSGGSLQIESEPGRGTTVRLFLPRADGDRRRTDDDEAIDQERPRGTGRILVVEDDAEVRELVVELLAGLGYRIAVAEDGAAALEALDNDGDIDLLFTDIVMPGGMSGLELWQTASARHKELKVVFTSGCADQVLGDVDAVAPGIPIVRKPYRTGELARTVRDVLDGD